MQTCSRRNLIKLFTTLPLAIQIPSFAAAPIVLDSETRDILMKTAQEAENFNHEYDAAVWLVDMNRRLNRYVKDPLERLTILNSILRESKANDLPPELVLSVMHVESLFNRFAVSSAGAQGLMQIMPFWKKELKRPNDNLMHIETNIYYGCTILKTYLRREKGNQTRALARYNGSLGKTWYPERVFRALEKYWFVKYS